MDEAVSNIPFVEADAIQGYTDNCGNAYVTGYTTSGDFPTTPGCFVDSINGSNFSSWDIFVFKLDPSGQGSKDLVYSTLIGGNRSDQAFDIAIDAGRNIYLTGYTASEEFPTTPGCYNASFEEPRRTIVVKLNHNGSELLYSTFLGGGNHDYLNQGTGIHYDPGNGYDSRSRYC